MKSRKSLAAAVIGGALIAAAGAACASGRSGSTVTVGAAGPWNEGYGLMNKRGLDLAVQEINARGGVGGRRLVVLERNDGGDGVRASAIAHEFVANPELVAVVGHVNSGAMVAAAKVYDGRLPAVATTATSPDLTGISPWVFRVISSDSANGMELGRFATGLTGPEGRPPRAAILYENNSYGRGLVGAFQRHFGGTIVSVDPIAATDVDFEPFIAHFKRARVDVVFVAGTEASGMAILREARTQDLRAAFVGGDGWAGVVQDTAAAEGAYVGTPFTAEDPRPEAQTFVTAFKRKYGVVPDGNAAMAYDATMLVARAIEEAGPDRTQVRDYLAGLGATTAFAGVTGPIRFQASGDPTGRGIVMTRISRGAMLVAAPNADGAAPPAAAGTAASTGGSR